MGVGFTLKIYEIIIVTVKYYEIYEIEIFT